MPREPRHELVEGAAGVDPRVAGGAETAFCGGGVEESGEAAPPRCSRRTACGRRTTGSLGRRRRAVDAPAVTGRASDTRRSLGERLEPGVARLCGAARSDRESGVRPARAVHDGDRDRDVEEPAAADDAVPQTRWAEETVVERGRRSDPIHSMRGRESVAFHASITASRSTSSSSAASAASRGVGAHASPLLVG